MNGESRDRFVFLGKQPHVNSIISPGNEECVLPVLPSPNHLLLCSVFDTFPDKQPEVMGNFLVLSLLQRTAVSSLLNLSALQILLK